jgi:hypothetical protein
MCYGVGTSIYILELMYKYGLNSSETSARLQRVTELRSVPRLKIQHKRANTHTLDLAAIIGILLTINFLVLI